MSLIINHNMMAMNATRNLGNAYKNLSTSVQRLSSGLRINSAADDAAGLAIREMMRADIATTMQGLRNAADAISLIQTADGALAVIDEKLIRMKELAEQAATGTYTTAQREIINSEYQAMAREIDRIANATNFNGVKLLDGSVSNQHGGLGLKVHFGVGNDAAEDYYFINLGDARATSQTGLRIAGDAKNDIWAQGAAAAAEGGAGCCTAGFTSLNGDAGFADGQSFSYGYNWDWMAQNAPGYANGDSDPNSYLLTGKYLAGRYEVQAGESLQDLIDKVNAGTQSRVGIKLDNTSGRAAAAIMSGAGLAVCVGDEAYVWGDLTRAEGGLATIATFEYLYRVAGLRAGNAENSMFTNNAGLQGLLGWGSAEISTILKNAPDMEAARAELAMIIDRMNNGGLFLSATAGTIAKGYTNATSVQIALDILQAKAGGSVYTSATGQQIFDELMAMGVSFNSAGTMVAFTAANFTFNGVLGNDAGSATVNNLWVNVNDPTQWTTHSALAKLDANNWQAFTFSVADWNSGTATLATIMASAYAHYNIGGAGGFVQAANKNEIIGGGPLQVWGDDSTGVWTTSASIGKALGLSQVSYGGAGGTLQNLGASQNAPVTAGLLLGGAAFDTTDLTTRITSINANVLNSTIGTGVYWNGAYWTDDVALGKALEGNGFEEFRPAWTGDPGSFSDFVSALAPLADMNIKVTADILKNKSQIFFTSASNVTMKRGSVDEQVAGYVDPGKNIYQVGDGTGGYFNAYSLAKAINENKDSQFWAMLDQNDSTVLYVFNKEGGEYNNLLACDVYDVDQMSQKMRSEYVAFENVENTKGMAPGDHRWVSAGTNFTLGSTAAGVWGKMKPILTKETGGNEVWNVVLSGKDVGDARDLWIAAARDIKLPGLFDGYDSIINGLDRHSFVETQDAADGLWAGADVRTQSHAQEALEALNYSIDVKDKIRADLGALQNRLENTMTNLEIQAENLQASESRISDVDVAREMTEFTKNNVLTQAATGMLAQANSLSQLALSLIR